MKKGILTSFGIIVIGIGIVSYTSSCSKDPQPPSSNCDPGCKTVQCYSNTQQGIRCKNMTTNCCGRCYLHK